MSVFKSLTTSDVIVTPFKVNKSFSFAGSSSFLDPNVSINRLIGLNIPYISGSQETGQINKQSKSLIYNSIKQLYYSMKIIMKIPCQLKDIFHLHQVNK